MLYWQETLDCGIAQRKHVRYNVSTCRVRFFNHFSYYLSENLSASALAARAALGFGIRS